MTSVLLQPAMAGAKTQIYSDNDDELHQDVVSQFPFLNGYTHLVFLFQPLDSDKSRENIIATLQAALDKLTAQVPWLAGQVLHTPGPPGSSGYYSLAPWPPDVLNPYMLRVVDCGDRLPSMAQIVRAGAPVSMLDANVLAPFPSLPVPHGLEAPIPVMGLQANFLHGGIIINLATHYIILDGNGIVQVMRHLATLLQGRNISAADLEQANRDRRSVVPLIPRNEPVKDHSYLRAQ